MGLERFLKGMKLPVGSGEALDSGDGSAVRLDRKREAGASGFTINQDRATTTDSVFAADVRARETDGVTKDVGQKPACLDVNLVRDRIDRQLDARALARLQRHYDSPLAWAFATARLPAVTPSLRARWALNATVA